METLKNKNAEQMNEDLQKAKLVVESLISNNIDITSDYNDWVKTGFAMSQLGEDGRALFHRVSCLNAGYSYEEADAKYDNCLKTAHIRTGSSATAVSLGTFFELAQRAGVIIPQTNGEAKPRRGRPAVTDETRAQQYLAKVKWLTTRYDLRYNTWTCMPEFIEKDGYGNRRSNEWKRFDDRQINTTVDIMAKHGIIVSPKQLMCTLSADGVSPSHNPLRAYLETTAPWDGQTDHISAMFDHIGFESEDDRAFCLPLLKKWFVRAVALALDEVDDNQVMPVLIGQQNVGKTFFCKNLCPPALRRYFHTILPGDNLNDKDTLISISENMLVNFDELTINPHFTEQIKALLSISHKNLRRPFAMAATPMKRRASTIATTNNFNYLSSREGNRRFLSVMVKSTKRIDATFPVDAAYAQAYALIKAGDTAAYSFTQDDTAAISSRTDSHVEETVVEAIVNSFFRKPTPTDEGVMLLKAGEIMSKIPIRHPELTPRNIGKAMRDLGFECKAIHKTTKYYVCMIDHKQQESNAKSEGREFRQTKIAQADSPCLEGTTSELASGE